jgi:hypothetical protein
MVSSRPKAVTAGVVALAVRLPLRFAIPREQAVRVSPAS